MANQEKRIVSLTRLEKFLVRFAINKRPPFWRQFLAWNSKRQMAHEEPTSSLRYDFQIPDPSRPIPEGERGLVGPSGHLIPFVPQELLPKDVIGRQVDEVTPYVGTYGMGGPGFFGLKLGKEWLVFAIWGAGDWIWVNDIFVEDPYLEKYERPEPWLHDGTDTLSSKLVGTEISSIEIHRHSMAMSFSNGMSLAIDEAPESRPIFEGNKRYREFLEDDDLRKAVFLAPTTELWI